MTNLAAFNRANIHNLTNLWKKMGVSELPSEPLHSDFTTSSSFPHRYWCDWDNTPFLPSSAFWAALPTRHVVPVWCDKPYAKELEQTLLALGYSVRFAQQAMYLELEHYAVPDFPPPDITRVSSPKDIETWVQIASNSFGYAIDSSVIENIANDQDIKLFTLHCGDAPAAVGMLYKSGTTVGVHQVGVTEEFRGRGIARTLMHYLLQVCVDWQATLVTLQASASGEGLYKQLGFTRQFSIRNYSRSA
ncbi:MAG: GNAT family N-acetyltransferase [Kofleriaceae bacterium]|nr:GNAT family N-acetyltransferase [Kofleriaceae bacterium]